MAKIQGIEISEDDEMLAEDMGLGDFIGKEALPLEELIDMFGEGGAEEVKEHYGL